MRLRSRIRWIKIIVCSLLVSLLLPLGVCAQTGAREYICERLRQYDEFIDVASYRLTYREAKELVEDIVQKDGTMFYVDGVRGSVMDGEYATGIQVKYLEHREEIEKALKRAIRESITPDMSDLQKILALHNWLAVNCKYDDSHTKYTAYDALVKGSAVCEGYAEAYHMLLRYAGILEVGMAYEKLPGGDTHVSNQVRLDGQWYNVDVTWDSGIVYAISGYGRMGYANFLCSDSKFLKNHGTFTAQDHVCTSTLYDDGGWWCDNPKVRSAAVPINGAGSYKIDYEDSVMKLIYRAEATGEERVLRVFDRADWSRKWQTQDGVMHWTIIRDCYGVLQRVGRTTFLNDTENVYRITDDGDISVIYTYEGADGRKIFGIRPEKGELKVQIGYRAAPEELETRTVSLEPYIIRQEDPEEKKIRDFVRRMYRITLGREADADGLDYYVNGLLSGEMDGSTVAQGFVLSPEFQGKELNADDYLAALYSAFFDRGAGPAEVGYWKDEMASGKSRKYVLRGFVNSDEFERLCREAGINRGLMVLAEGEEYENRTGNLADFVERLYVKALGREAEPAGRQYWIEQIQSRKVTAKEAAEKFFFSPEFESFHTGNAEYIERLYQTFMGRASEPAGMSYWMDQISRGMSREAVLSRFAASPEFGKIMESFGL